MNLQSEQFGRIKIKRQGIQTAKFDAKTIVWKKSTVKLEMEQLWIIW